MGRFSELRCRAKLLSTQSKKEIDSL
uniref:Uncharacterized protein n=1 Tax=Anguilla anguilla TaxID=7936 RepID=A0A0E9TTY3_ANGAN